MRTGGTLVQCQMFDPSTGQAHLQPGTLRLLASRLYDSGVFVVPPTPTPRVVEAVQSTLASGRVIVPEDLAVSVAKAVLAELRPAELSRRT